MWLLKVSGNTHGLYSISFGQHSCKCFSKALISSVQFSCSVVPTLCDQMNYSAPGLPVLNATCLKPELLFPTATLLPLLPKLENFIFLVNETLARCQVLC